MKIKFKLTKIEKEFIRNILPLPSNDFVKQASNLNSGVMKLNQENFDELIAELTGIYNQESLSDDFREQSLSILDKIAETWKYELE